LPINHVQILKTFADQAVIAISNVELFREVQARTRELSQSLDDLRSARRRHQQAGRGKPQPCLSRCAREFDASAGAAELFPQEITRALLNLISNGFYAATKRKIENGEEPFEPTLPVTTRNLGTSVEIRIRDNGTGIPTDVKEKIFNPFFTTKPAGEGTGLGLSMTHDIIVKQHGGTIRVDTEPGE
jgi:signal transduction histidine kinase